MYATLINKVVIINQRCKCKASSETFCNSRSYCFAPHFVGACRGQDCSNLDVRWLSNNFSTNKYQSNEYNALLLFQPELNEPANTEARETDEILWNSDLYLGKFRPIQILAENLIYIYCIIMLYLTLSIKSSRKKNISTIFLMIK